MRISSSLLGTLAVAVIALPAGAQNRDKAKAKEQRDETPRAVRIYSSNFENDDEDRAVLGISTGNSGKRDTLGLLIQSVTAGSPAEKAGLEEGNRIAAINSTSLRLAAADAGEPDMGGIMTRRLSREMRKVKAGDDVELRVWQDGQFRTVKVKTVAAEDLRPARMRFSRDDMEDRPVIGVNVGATGSRRDTLGIMVSSVAEDGPAEKAGIYEGDRIAAINDISLRVSAEDAGDSWVSNVKANRFRREMAKVKAGDEVTLRVYSSGAFKTVKVKAARSADVYKDQHRTGFFFGDGGEFAPMAPMPPMPPMPAIGAFGGGRVFQLRSPEISGRVNEAVQRALEAAGRATQGFEFQLDDQDEDDDMTPAIAPRATPAPDAPRARSAAPAPRAASGWVTATSWTPEPSPVAATLRRAEPMSGLRLAAMNDDLAGYFAADATVRDGILVVDSDGSWGDLRTGDVVVGVNGQPVHARDARSLRLDRSRDNVVEVVRKGKRTVVRIPAE